MTGPAPARPLPRRLWVLAGAMGLAAAGTLSLVAALPPVALLPPPRAVPWIAIAVLAFLTEMCPVHIEYRSEAHRVSLSEVLVTAALFFVPPLTLVLAYTVGGSCVYFVRRRPLIKLAINGANLLLLCTTAVLVFRWVLGDAPPLGARGWIAAVVATIAAALQSVLLIVAAIRIVQGGLPRGQIVHTAAVAVIGGVVATTTSLTAVVLLESSPAAVSLLGSTWLVMIAMYRVAVRSRDREEQLGFLYQTTRMLHRVPEVETALVELLDAAQASLRAAVAEVTLLPDDGDAGLRTTTRLDGPPTVMASVAVPAEEYAGFVDGATNAEPIVITADTTGPLAGSLRERGITDAIVAPLYDDTRLAGVVLVGNRLGRTAGRFGEEERRLVATLTNQVALALTNGRLARALDELTALRDELRHQALHDPLTGLANRVLFGRRVEDAIAAARDGGRAMAVLFLDLDDFKMVNDTLGHATGDELLVRIAELIQPCLRDGDTAARLGGDEFGICLGPFDTDGQAVAVAERILALLDVPVAAGGHHIDVRASIGIAVGGAGPTDASDLLREADVAMYAAKGGGKSGYQMFDVSMQERVTHRHALTLDLRQAVERREFEVHYQPIVRVGDGSIAGFEALVRWDNGRRGMVSPAEFVPLAEDLDLIGSIGAFVLRQAVRDVTSWRNRLGLDLSVSVNVSSRQLRSRYFAADVAAVLGTCGLPPNALILEITETAMLEDLDLALRGLAELKAAGVRIAIDDFGTGYSGLQQLQQLPVDIVKIAKPFVDGLLWDDGKEAALARAIVQLGHTLGLGLVAEGVERPEQVERLAAAGCGLAQGFYYGRPEPAAVTARLLADTARTPAPGNVIPMQRDGQSVNRTAGSTG